MAHDRVNVWATFRYALAYPDAEHLERFRALFNNVPASLEDLRALYIQLFEAGAPHSKCPLLESYYVLNRPAGDVVLENKLFYKHFGLGIESKAAPDHLLTQLEFLSWLDYCVESGNAERESIELARNEFVSRHLSHWIPRAAKSCAGSGAACYSAVLDELAACVKALK